MKKPHAAAVALLAGCASAHAQDEVDEAMQVAQTGAASGSSAMPYGANDTYTPVGTTGSTAVGPNQTGATIDMFHKFQSFDPLMSGACSTVAARSGETVR